MELYTAECGPKITIEPYDKDDAGREIRKGQRCRVTIKEVGRREVSFVADRNMAFSILHFLAYQEKVAA